MGHIKMNVRRSGGNDVPRAISEILPLLMRVPIRILGLEMDSLEYRCAQRAIACGSTLSTKSKKREMGHTQAVGRHTRAL